MFGTKKREVPSFGSMKSRSVENFLKSALSRSDNILDFLSPKPSDATYYMNRKCDEMAKAGGGYEYEFVNPLTKAKQKKRACIELVPGTEIYVMCGVFL
jgi:hypothetical protein